MTTLNRITAFVLALAGPASNALAQSPAPSPTTVSPAAVDPKSLTPELRMNRAFITYGFDYLASYPGMVSPQDSLRLAMIAKQRAIGQLCNEFEVDEQRYNMAMKAVLDPLIAAGSAPADKPAAAGPRVNIPFAIAMSGYSIFLGGHLAAGAYDLRSLCAFGSELSQQHAASAVPSELFILRPAK